MKYAENIQNGVKSLLTIKLSMLFYNDLTPRLNGWHGREGEHIWRMSLFMSPRQNAIVRIVQGPLRKPVSCSGRREFLHSFHLLPGFIQYHNTFYFPLLWKSCKIGNEVFFCISCVTQKSTESTEVTKRSNYSNNEQKSIQST